MNKISLEKQVQIIMLIAEGNSLRATSRITNCSINTIMSLFCAVGRACERFHDDTVVNVHARRIEVDELWSFVYAKEKNALRTNNAEAGDCWTWTAIDAETKLIISWTVGKRDAETAYIFMDDVASRLTNRVQMTSDGNKSYLDAVENSFEGCIDFAQLVKLYGVANRADGKVDRRRRYLGSEKTVINGRPNPKFITTSHIERHNLTLRQHNRRFGRDTNAFSKKLDNHRYGLAIHFVYYNFVRLHSSIGGTPAMEAGLRDRWMEVKDMIGLVDLYSYSKYDL
ncbi:MAG: DDE-type integrase/transposase/recombinase [Bacteroidetes bacterium]|nr:DDE-type integrase/transposase/recombinase [Bacteroidota bacterium]